MRLTDKQLTKYQNIYQDTYGKPISKDKALEQGLALLRLIKKITNRNNNEPEKNNEPAKPTT